MAFEIVACACFDTSARNNLNNINILHLGSKFVVEYSPVLIIPVRIVKGKNIGAKKTYESQLNNRHVFFDSDINAP